MDDPSRVRLIERVGDLQADLDDFPDRKRSLRHPRRQQFALDILHDEEGPIGAVVQLTRVERTNDIGMIEQRQRLVAATRADNAKSISVLKQHGLQFMMQEKDVDPAELLRIRDQAARVLAASGYIPQPVFDRVRVLLDDYRRKKPGSDP